MNILRLFVCLSGFLAISGTALAKRLSYEIDGQVYYYSTNNVAQTREAKRRMEEARAKKVPAPTPLPSIFGSFPEQPAASAPTASTNQIAPPGSISVSEAERRIQEQDERRSRFGKNLDQDRKMRRRRSRDRRSETTLPNADAPAIAATSQWVNSTEPSLRGEMKPKDSRKGISSVHFDLKTGIKTTFKRNGEILEEPFDVDAYKRNHTNSTPAESKGAE